MSKGTTTEGGGEGTPQSIPTPSSALPIDTFIGRGQHLRGTGQQKKPCVRLHMAVVGYSVWLCTARANAYVQL